MSVDFRVLLLSQNVDKNLSSVTRFGEISPLGQTLKSLKQYIRVYLVFGRILNLIWQKFHAIGLNFVFLNGQT